MQVKKIMSVFLKILTTALIVVLLLILYLNIATLWSVERIKDGGWITSGYFSAVIGSGSMSPALSVNDVLIVKADVSYQIEDIITYVSSKGGLITHRVKEVTDNGYIAQGDANNVPDEEIPGQRVLGKVVFSIPRAGAIIDGILSPAGIILLASIFILLWLIQRIRNDENEDDEESEN